MRYYDPMHGQIDTERVAKTNSYLAAEETAYKTDFSESERRELAKSGAAMSDGSYPIRNGEDLHHAISLVGMSNHSESSVKAHIKTRAKALGLESALPDDWKEDAKKSETVQKDDDGDPTKPDATPVVFKPQPYSDIMRSRHPQAKLQTPGQFQSVSGQVVQPQDVPNAKITPTPGLSK